MKNITLIACSVILTFSLTAFTYTSWNHTPNTNNNACGEPTVRVDPPTFSYDIDSRFMANVTKEDLRNAKTIIDIVPKKANWDRFNFREVTIRVMPDENNNYAKGESKELNLDQIKLLKTIDYSTNFVVDTYVENSPKYYDHYPYYITVIPEKEASYMLGKQAVINYLKESCASTIAKIERGYLKSGKAHFIISKDGTIKNVNLESTSGYPTVDKKMLALIATMPGMWIPATNQIGEKVEQELVFSFGTMGC
jgi:hypothetical protein